MFLNFSPAVGSPALCGAAGEALAGAAAAGVSGFDGWDGCGGFGGSRAYAPAARRVARSARSTTARPWARGDREGTGKDEVMDSSPVRREDRIKSDRRVYLRFFLTDLSLELK
jgi:hypothetical protein